MPNGYTSKIYNGESVSLRQYLMSVGRGMGFAILQRDDDLDAPVKFPEDKESWDEKYHKEGIETAKADLRKAHSMTYSEAKKAAEEAYQQQLACHEEAKRENNALRKRYEDMIEQVEAWEPDERVAYVKDYALRWLRESIEFDCRSVHPKHPVSVAAPEDYRRELIEEAKRSLKYHSEQLVSTQRRELERRAVIQAFLDSLPQEDSDV